MTREHGNYHITATLGVGGIWVDFRVVQIVGRQKGGPTLYGNDMDSMVESPAESAPFIEAHVKWDSCSHFEFHDQPIHVCGYDHWDDMASLGRELFTMAREMMGDKVDPAPRNWPSIDAAKAT